MFVSMAMWRSTSVVVLLKILSCNNILSTCQKQIENCRSESGILNRSFKNIRRDTLFVGITWIIPAAIFRLRKISPSSRWCRVIWCPPHWENTPYFITMYTYISYEIHMWFAPLTVECEVICMIHVTAFYCHVHAWMGSSRLLLKVPSIWKLSFSDRCFHSCNRTKLSTVNYDRVRRVLGIKVFKKSSPDWPSSLSRHDSCRLLLVDGSFCELSELASRCDLIFRGLIWPPATNENKGCILSSTSVGNKNIRPRAVHNQWAHQSKSEWTRDIYQEMMETSVKHAFPVHDGR